MELKIMRVVMVLSLVVKVVMSHRVRVVKGVSDA